MKFFLFILLLVISVEVRAQDMKLKRDDITFILGGDKEGGNPYYTHAENFYRYDEKSSTEQVITNLRSLSEVQIFLIENAPRNGAPWGVVNLVTHGNPYLGLSVKIYPDGQRADAVGIMTALNEDRFIEWPDSLFDEQSKISIHGCGLGNNLALVDALTAFFQINSNAPEMELSEYFEYYLADPDNPKKVKQMQAEFWTINYKFGYRPTDRGIYNRFKAKYPDENVDWKKAILSETGHELGDVFFYTYDVPVKWVLKFTDPTLVPNLTTKSDRLKWVNQQPEFLEHLSKIQIPPENFNWWMRKVNAENDDGTSSPALWIKGHSTFYCILKLRDASI